MRDHALVIGKFYPPHAGHHLLIREAARVAARVTVVVMASGSSRFPWRTECPASPNRMRATAR